MSHFKSTTHTNSNYIYFVLYIFCFAYVCSNPTFISTYKRNLNLSLFIQFLFQIFSNGDGYNELWYITWDIISEFLPNLKEELFPEGTYFFINYFLSKYYVYVENV